MAWKTYTASRARPPDLGYTAQELADAFGVSRSTVYKLRKSGAVAALKFTRSVRFPRKSVRELMNTKVARVP